MRFEMHELSLEEDGIEIVRRDDHYYVRYDAGAHQICWREDEISEEDAVKIKTGRTGEYEVMLGLQKRLLASGIDPYVSNWTPSAK
jgi:hypothetical protein